MAWWRKKSGHVDPKTQRKKRNVEQGLTIYDL